MPEALTEHVTETHGGHKIHWTYDRTADQCHASLRDADGTWTGFSAEGWCVDAVTAALERVAKVLPTDGDVPAPDGSSKVQLFYCWTLVSRNGKQEFLPDRRNQFPW